MPTFKRFPQGGEETKNIEEAQEILNNLDTRELLKCYTEVVIPSSTIGEMVREKVMLHC